MTYKNRLIQSLLETTDINNLNLFYNQKLKFSNYGN